LEETLTERFGLRSANTSRLMRVAGRWILLRESRRG